METLVISLPQTASASHRKNTFYLGYNLTPKAYNLLEILHAVDSVSFIWDDLFEMDDAGTVDVISDSSEDGVGLFVGLLDLSLV